MFVKSERVWLDGQFRPATIEIGNGTVKSILPYETETEEDYGAERILPGFIDIHTHGAYDFDTNSADREGLKYWAANIVKEGVTSFVPTTVTDKEETLLKALHNIADVMEEEYQGAEILGAHLEGPYISKLHKGSQPEEWIRGPDINQFERFYKAARGHIISMTLAPEKDPDGKFISYLNHKNIMVSMGHSDVDLETALKASLEGARSFTHVYNGMSGFHHRHNGMVGAALYLKDMYGEIIADGKHSTFEAVNILATCKGKDHLMLVSDSLSVKGLPCGTRRLFGGQEITLNESGLALLKDGTIAGSTLTMNTGLKNLIEKAQVPLVSAINAATINPARCLGIDRRKGSIEVGKDGDLVIIDDDYEILQTYAKGKRQL